MAVSKYLTAIGMIVIVVVAFVVGLYASPLIFPPPKEADPVWARVKQAGRMIVGTEPGWPPYEFRNVTTNQIVGFEIELTEMIAEDLNLTVEWRDMLFDSIVPAVQAMDIDLGVSGFSIYPDRLDVIQYTIPHSITEGQIIMLKSKADAKGITTLTSLTNLTDLDLKCGTQAGTTQRVELLEKAPGALVTYSDFLLALDDMKRGVNIDCIYAETPITSNWIFEAAQAGEPPIVVIFRRPYYPVAFVAHNDADTFVAKMNAALTEIIASAELDQLKQKWKCD